MVVLGLAMRNGVVNSDVMPFYVLGLQRKRLFNFGLLDG